MSARSISFLVIVVLLACVAYLEFVPRQKPRVPAVSVVPNCGKLKPKMKRIGDYGLQFDVPVSDFKLKEALFDTPTPKHEYGIRPTNGASELAISWYEEHDFEGTPEIPALMFSGYFEKRRIIGDQGKVIGEDDWGRWDRDERWRRVYFWGGIAADYGSRNEGELHSYSYGSVHEKDAILFDEIISSACRVPALQP